MDESDSDRDDKGRFLSGGKAGPGRPKGSRNKLSEDFVADLYTKWNEHGTDALDKMAKEDPSGFVKVVAGLMPKDVNLNVNPLEEKTTEELLAELGNLQSLIAQLSPDTGQSDQERAGTPTTH